MKTLARRVHLALPDSVRSRVTETYINVRNGRFRGSDQYWKLRYEGGGDSGTGSEGRLAEFKAEVINGFVADHGIESVIEFGCGDGRQASMLDIGRYVGLDISPVAIRMAADRNRGDETKSFLAYDGDAFYDRAGVLTAELAMSLDVLYHLTEEPVRDRYLDALFAAASRFVMIYSTDVGDDVPAPSHVRHWPVEAVVDELTGPEWTLRETVDNPYAFDWASAADTSDARFYVYERSSPP